MNDLEAVIAAHEQAVDQYIRLVEQIIADLKASNPANQQAITNATNRLTALTAAIADSRLRVV